MNQRKPMPYPKRLLPQANFKKIAIQDTLRQQYLIHHTETKDIIDPNTRKLKLELVVRQTDHLRDYSNNLLGVFLIEDIFLAIQKCENKKYLTSEWEIGTDVIPPISPEEFKEEPERGYFFLCIGDCHEVLVPYQDSPNINPICILLHTPTNSNFWHFSLRWFSNGKEIINLTKGEQRRILTAAKTFIIERAKFKEPFFEELDSTLYKN